ncbi:DUF58 domain-containing protein [Natronolimnohabitans innermongolicus]|uniref:DUF58 domain-containing protein n=1 Tax=Natronolimnohabitans innermongolicus JCM 12255 TaxID=1227499 RepID=L9WUT5_9EURY|nr:DUF58 domain-containing protein [Natronolimnohabitans innermongolicus]ELY53254.1 hypothetical protein C493_14528 [Natronolimnohabitans innermongolicus JCM 12255]
MSDRGRQARWQVALVVALVTCLVAVALGLPALFFLAIVALGFVLVGEASRTPALSATEPAAESGSASAPGAESANDGDDERSDAEDGARVETADGLRFERTLEETRVRPGRSVTVTIAVTNESSRVVPDVRVVDEPPAEVPVTRGSPAFATAVQPGETVAHEYELTPPRGEYAFGSMTVRARSLPATALATVEREPAGDAEFTCETLLDAFPFQDRTIQFVGQAPTDDGGSGIEFFSTREYRRGDPINRIDWHRYARTRELTTVEYREERAVTIVFVVDDRRDAHRERPEGGPDSFDLTLYAASRGVVASIEDGNRTGLASLSGEWVDPGADGGVRRRVEETLEDVSAGTKTETAGNRGSRRSRTGSAVADGGSLAVDLERRLPNRAQVAFCTPLLDDAGVELVETLRTHGRAVTVVSPDVTAATETGDPSAGMRAVGLERTNRIDALRGVGAVVVDWNLTEPVSVGLARAFRAQNGGGSP